MTRAIAPAPPAVRPQRRTCRRAVCGVIALLAVTSAAAAPGCAARNKQGDSAAPDGSSAADKHYDVAVGSFHNGMFDDARLQLDKALTINPAHADSHYLQGLLLLNQGRSLVDAIEIEQCLTDAAANRQRERAQDLHAKARDAFRLAAEHYEENSAGRGRAHNSIAVVDLFFGELDSAVSEASEALEAQFYGDRYSALANLGWAYYARGDITDATTELRQSVLMNPDHCVGRYRLAQVYLDSERPDLALEHAQTVADNERCPIQDAHRIVGVANLRLGRTDDAVSAFASCYELAPRSCLAQDCRRFLPADWEPAPPKTKPRPEPESATPDQMANHASPQSPVPTTAGP